jgi:hypothetical protein
METFKQIIYRQEDEALMIIPQNEEIQIVPRFLKELSLDDKATIDSLISFCLTKVENLSYIIQLVDEDRIDIQKNDVSVVCLKISELEESEKQIVELAGSTYNKLLN